ncbi:hypothetical protein SLEP1_g14909 [Rubroshorea leprosula]|uniref:Uncharacterized protein n=1 Tax=Rubroshorea leprosula TaxID=152421 RepID=A0AAV5IW40_9ROSI|nr:hypothetical protein SLEP1_g14909 [Rubroshorea leprosula]
MIDPDFFVNYSLLDVLFRKFQNLLQGDDFYRIRPPSNVLSPPGRDYIISSVKAVLSLLAKWTFTFLLLD